MLIFRTMEIDADGKPRVGDRANQLGVRPADPTNPAKRHDVTASDPADPVTPAEGLSAAPDSPHNMYDFLKRQGRKPGYAVWVLDTAGLPPGLYFRPDGSTHGVIAPTVATPLASFQALLALTRDLWRVIEWADYPVPEPGDTP